MCVCLSTGVHCEGGLFLTLFALLMFDIIFAPIPGAFRHEFQEVKQTVLKQIGLVWIKLSPGCTNLGAA